jgi:PIN domain nuclease of toxin-antitoxin system
MLALDTHVLIWLMNGDLKLGPSVRDRIERAGQTDEIIAPVAVFWEIAMLVGKRRLELEAPVASWARDVIARPGLSVAPLTPEIAIEAYALPGRFHDDPADRMIVATARGLDATLVTRDRAILRYGQAGHVSVLAA